MRELIPGGIDKALSELSSSPTVADQKVHIDRLRDQLTRAEERMQKLEIEKAGLLKDKEGLRRQLHELESLKQGEFLDMGIWILKRKPQKRGRFEVLCGHCLLPLTDLKPSFLVCSACSTVKLLKDDVTELIRSLRNFWPKLG